MNTLDFSIYFQRSVLARVLKDKKFYLESNKYLKPKFFDTSTLKWICTKIVDENVRTTQILIENIKRVDNVDFRKAIREDVKLMIRKKNFDDAEYGINKIKEFISTQKLSTAVLEAAIKLKDGEMSNSIKKDLTIALSDSFENDIAKTVSYVKETSNRFKKREEKIKNKQLIFVPTGIKVIDDDIGGPMPGQFWAFFGNTNIGKSAFAANIGRCSSLMRYPTWHIVIEDELEATMQRYDAALTRVSYKTLTYCNYTKEEISRMDKIFDLIKKRKRDYLYISKIEEGCTMADIENEYNRIKMKYNFKPISIVLDSPHCMEATKKKENTRLDSKQIYQEIRKFVRREKVGLIAFDQSKQDVEGKIAGTNAFSESYDKMRILDGMITINQTRMQKKDGIIELFVGKMKDREKNQHYLVRPMFNIMRFESIMN